MHIPIRAVLDTNIVMDLFHFRDCRTERLRAAIAAGELHCHTAAECLAELDRVVAYPAFGLDEAAQRALIERYLARTTRCDDDIPIAALPRCRDADDQKFLELAARCRADLLVSRDKQLLRLAHHRHLPPPFAILDAVAAAHWLDARLNTQRVSSDTSGANV